MEVLDYLGVIAWVSRGLEPLFDLVGVPGAGAMVFLTGACSNLYAAVAVMATLAIDYRAAIILAVMGLVCHNLIIETAVQKKAGATGWQMAALRIGAAFLVALLLHRILPSDLSGRLWLVQPSVLPEDWTDLFVGWILTVGPLIVKMSVLIISLNLLQSIFREFNVIDRLVTPLHPLMRLFGLADSTSFLWVICNVVGLTYGGAAIVEEVRNGRAKLSDIRLLHTHVALSHSLVEDTLLFATIGVPLVLLLVPRLILAICAVWMQRLARKCRRKMWCKPVSVA